MENVEISFSAQSSDFSFTKYTRNLSVLSCPITLNMSGYNNCSTFSQIFNIQIYYSAINLILGSQNNSGIAPEVQNAHILNTTVNATLDGQQACYGLFGDVLSSLLIENSSLNIQVTSNGTASAIVGCLNNSGLVIINS